MAKKKINFILGAVNNTKKSFDVVTSGLGKMAGVAGSATKGVAAVGLAAAGTATALAVLVNKSFEFIDAIGKTATRTGIATDTIQAFHLAARESGTNIDGANKALEKFARSIGDAQRGLKTMKDIFKAIGVELETTDGHFKSTDQLLEEVAIGISNLGSQTQKATALANLFGRQGILLTGALEDLAEKGLDNFIERAERLGLILSTKTIRRVEQFNDAIGVIKMQIGSFVNNVSASFLPIFETMQVVIAEKIEKIIKKFKGMDGVAVFVQNSIIEFAAKSIIAVGNFGDTLFNIFQAVQIKLLGLEFRFLELSKSILTGMNIFGRFDGAIANLNSSMGENIVATNAVMLKTSDYGERAEAAASKLRAWNITVEDLRDSQAAFTKALEEANNELDRVSPINAFKDQLADVGKTLDSIAVNSMKKFEDSIVEGLKSGKLAFKDFADYVVEQLLRVAIQQLVIAQLIDPFRTFLSGFDVFSTPPIPSAVNDFMDTLPTGDTFFKSNNEGGGYTGQGVRSGGLDNKGGFPAILHPNETVVDHTKGQSLGGGSTTVNFNISTVDAAGFDDLLQSRKGLITQIINNSMNKQGKMGIL